MSGRDITDAEETTRTPVALVNQTMAKELWPEVDPIGRRFRLTGATRPEWFTVVGVIADFRHFQGDSNDAGVSRRPTCRTRSTPRSTPA